MKWNLVFWMAAVATLTACDKGFEEVSEPTLELSTSMTTYYTQEPVVFHIESNASSNIQAWSIKIARALEVAA